MTSGPVFALALEPELVGPTPRPIPDALARGPYARARRVTTLGLAAIGALCLLAAQAPVVGVLARYLLPLAYLEWIGLAALVGSAVSFVDERLKRTGPYRWVRHGVPLRARVVELVKAPSVVVNGDPTHHAFTARVEVAHPETGAVEEREVVSNSFSSSHKHRYDTPFKVGDDVTALYLPGRFEETLRLYAFLDLRSDLGLRRGAGGDSPWKAAGLALLVIAIFAVLIGNVYSFGRYLPIDFDYRQGIVPLLAGGLLMGGGFLAWLYRSHRREQERIAEQAEQARLSGAALEVGSPLLGQGAQGWLLRVAVGLGAPLVGGLSVLCWCFLANALLDRSPARQVPATVTGTVVKTHALVLRDYTLEYTLEGVVEKRRLMTTPDHLAQFSGPAAVAQVRAGRFGWPWVEAVVPTRGSD